MRKETNIPSIDKTHLKNETFLHLHPVIPNMSVYNSLKFIGSKYKNDNAIDCLDLNVTYGELINNAAILSRAFKELGIKKGDIISVVMPNYYQAVAVFLAANRIGATTTFLNSFSSEEEIKHYLNLFESPLLVNFNKTKEYNQSIAKDTKIRQIVTLGPSELNTKEFNYDTTRTVGYDNFLSFNDMGAVSKYYKHIIPTMSYGGNTDALILFTSGTTGNPKSVVLTNENVLASGIYMKNSTSIKVTSGERCFVGVPFCYPYGFTTSLLMTLLCGREAVLAPDLSKDNLCYFLSKNSHIIFGSPALLEMIKKVVPDDFDLSSIHTFISGGDFLTVPTSIAGKEFFMKHGASVAMCNGSGNAETTATSTTAVGVPSRPETVGKILVGSTAIIVDDTTSHELKYGEEGLLCISGKHVFKEYYKEKELTEEAKFEYKGKTYFKTGTRGFLDKDGYFTLTGRDARFYIMSTLNKVYCDRVQLIMSDIDVIDSVAVVKKPSDEFLYTSKAFIVLKDGVEENDITKEYIFDRCHKPISTDDDNKCNQLKEYEIPTSIEFVKELPRATSDKIDYASLETNALEEYEQEKSKPKIYSINSKKQTKSK